ncbi:hypothetical protein GCM10023189_32830 [Nibrella saemangeumensis]|uniref:HTH cro/C1-type domain-containing protein n=1 Tax=Nibrella saemangeumensis TaxID=1084526 RepID=A0ABP8N0Q5_9BACT
MTEVEKENFHRLLGDNIRREREQANLKQDTLAARIGLSRASIINIEKGRQAPPVYLIWEISKVLAVPIQKLFPTQEPDLCQTKPLLALDDKVMKSLEKHFEPSETSMENVKNFLLSATFR